jgi:hypothetical protein
MLLNMVSFHRHDAETSSHRTPEVTFSLSRIYSITFRPRILPQFSNLLLNELHLYGFKAGIVLSH